METQTVFYVVRPGPRPPFGRVAEKLWGTADFDSDGNSRSPSDTSWTELTIELRPECAQRVDVDCVSKEPLVLKVVSSSPVLAERAARYLAVSTQGEFSREWRNA